MYGKLIAVLLAGVVGLNLTESIGSASDLSRLLGHSRVDLAFGNGPGYGNYYNGYGGYAPVYQQQPSTFRNQFMAQSTDRILATFQLSLVMLSLDIHRLKRVTSHHNQAMDSFLDLVAATDILDIIRIGMATAISTTNVMNMAFTTTSDFARSMRKCRDSHEDLAEKMTAIRISEPRSAASLILSSTVTASIILRRLAATGQELRRT